MGIGRWLALALLGMVCAVPARAEPPRPPMAPFESQLESLLGPGAILGGVLTERDLDLVIAHVRAALLAAAAGSEPPSNEALGRRAEEIGNALRARGVLAALLLIDALEARARERLRDLPSRRIPSPPPPAHSAPGP